MVHAAISPDAHHTSVAFFGHALPMFEYFLTSIGLFGLHFVREAAPAADFARRLKFEVSWEAVLAATWECPLCAQ